MTATKSRTSLKEERLLIEEADAWFSYTEACKDADPARYEEVEGWAWARLQSRLRQVKRQRKKLAS